MGRSWVGVLGVCVAAACGGSGGSGTHLSATPGADGGDGGVPLPDGGSLACTQDPGPAVATCSELAPGPFGPRETFLYPQPEPGCGDDTPTNGEGAFIAVENQV